MNRRRGYTLTEIMVVVTIMFALIPMLARLLNHEWQGSMRILRTADAMERCLRVKQLWRHTLKGTASGEWQTTGAEFRVGDRSVSISDGALVFAAGDDGFRCPLPPDMACRFTIEREDAESDRAVLWLEWTGKGGARSVPRTLRLVAYGKDDA